jgi:hypothetical protein
MVTSTTVSYALNCPDEMTAVASAAALTLSGEIRDDVHVAVAEREVFSLHGSTQRRHELPERGDATRALCFTKLLMPSAL